MSPLRQNTARIINTHARIRIRGEGNRHLTSTSTKRAPDKDGWLVLEERFDPVRQRGQETVFAVGNGRFATRGSFEEGYPGDQPATLAHGVFAPHPLAVSELANLPDWTALDVLVRGERFSLATGNLLSYRRHLDLSSGLLTREVTWRSPEGNTVELVFERFASLAEPQLAAVRVRVTALDFDGRVEVRAALDTRADTDGLAHLVWNEQTAADTRAFLGVDVGGTQTRVGLAMRLRVREVVAEHDAWDVHEHPTLVARWRAQPGTSATFEKTVAIVTSRQSDEPVRTAVEHLDALADYDFDALHAASEEAWRHDWAMSDVIIEGDPQAQLALRFSLYHLLIAAPRNDEQVSIGAKALAGFGYRGHVFWDTETFMLPFFTHVHPHIARNMLSYRYHRLAGARRKAAGNGYAGAQFPWESAETGDEVTPTWLPGPAGDELVRIWTGDLEIHISAVIAHAVVNYWRATGDDLFMRERGAEIVIDSARFWASRAEWKAQSGRYEFSDVIGPDENHDHVDNNAFTNYLAAWHLRAAVEISDWLSSSDPKRAAQLLGSDARRTETLSRFREVADRIYLPYDPATGLVEQFSGYFDLRDVDLAQHADRTHSMQAILGIEGVTETQIVKQPDVLMLAKMLPEMLSPRDLAANFAYYTPRTDYAFGSSLGPAIQALMAARMDRAAEAYDQFVRAAGADLADVRGNAADGIHAANAGALWQAVVFGFGGVRFDGEEVVAEPHLPVHWRRLAFRLLRRGRLVEFDLTPVPAVASMTDTIRGLIFDLDGVITDTAEAHYLAWQRLADEEGLPFDRAANEALRGISRRESLGKLLGGRRVSVAHAEELMERKNGYYRELIAQITPADLLPGALELIDEARALGLKVAIASASRNARDVLDNLGIGQRFDATCDGHTAAATKPAPDLFLAAAAALGLPPETCVVFEDAADGIKAAQAAGMMSVGIGPVERVGAADVVLQDGFAATNLDALVESLARRSEFAA
jgi:beta-phosphoglucomutase